MDFLFFPHFPTYSMKYSICHHPSTKNMYLIKFCSKFDETKMLIDGAACHEHKLKMIIIIILPLSSSFLNKNIDQSIAPSIYHTKGRNGLFCLWPPTAIPCIHSNEKRLVYNFIRLFCLYTAHILKKLYSVLYNVNFQNRFF